MRVVAGLLLSLLILAWTPGVSLAAEGMPTGGEAEVADDHTMAPPADDGSWSLTLQEVAVGTAVLSGAFAVGLLAGGSLSTGIAAASAVVLVYNVMP